VESLDNEGRSGHTVYKIIRLDKILPAHPATLQNDYDVLVQEVQTLGRRKAIEAFIDEKIKTTYIVIDPMFAGCPFEHAGWSAKIRKD
jgi:peptidyl-prolyl cis-trans isomerase SurA